MNLIFKFIFKLCLVGFASLPETWQFRQQKNLEFEKLKKKMEFQTKIVKKPGIFTCVLVKLRFKIKILS